jgi:SAM-dependent methyltransferase
MGKGDPFVECDQAYLRNVQYSDSTRLSARASLHVKCGTAPVAWFPWLASQVTWPRRARVLEVGCGTGWLWIEAAAHLPRDLDLTLTDLSEGMVIEALARVDSGRRHRRVVGGVADAQTLPCMEHHFDVAVANHMLYHVPEPAKAVAELRRVLRPEGLLVAATNGRGHLRELFEIRDDVFGRPETTVADVFGIDIGHSILASGFDDVEWLPYEDRLVCYDPDDVVAFLASFPPAEDASPAQQERLAAAVRERFDAGGGVLEISKETGVFLCCEPRLEGGR